jgi:hypothetical protein
MYTSCPPRAIENVDIMSLFRGFKYHGHYNPIGIMTGKGFSEKTRKYGT